jgi:pimeloyl-ACP methyl ester carboxylesterase
VSAYTVAVDQAVLDDLHERIARTRWPDAIAGAGWERGTDAAYLRALAAGWLEYDWRHHEAALNELDHVRLEVDGFGLHAVRQDAAEAGATPLLLLHGWPDSFLRFRRVLPLLTGFHVVVPSLPGYGFSDKPPAGGYSRARAADLMAGLMGALGHDRFIVSGGDIGSGVAEQLGFRHPERLLGMHLTDVPFWHLGTVDAGDLTEAEAAYLQAGRTWQRQEAAYALMQSTRPMTAAFGLSDSPLGLAAWIVEKLRAWSDCDGDIERRFPLEDVLTSLTLYWVTNTIASSFGVYYEADPPAERGRLEIPTAVTRFPHDLVPAPRVFGERFFDIRRWTEPPCGGHFGAWEEPEVFAGELRAFAAELR